MSLRHPPVLALVLALALVAAACGTSADVGSAAPTATTVAATPTVGTTPTAAPAEPTVAPTRPTEEPTEAPTATPPSTCSELSEGAELVHPAAGAVDADLDGDGVGDEFWISTSDDFEDGNLVQVVLSSDGSASEPFPLGGAFGAFDAVLAAADLDGDGADAVFYSLSGNTLLVGVVLDLDGCTLRAATTDEPALDWGDGMFSYLYAAGGNSCGPSGCYYSVVCVPGESAPEVVLTSVYPAVSALDPDFDEAQFDIPLADQQVVFGQITVQIMDGRAVVVDRTDDEIVRLGDIPEWTSITEVRCDLS